MKDAVGRVEPGYAADLVLLGADPLADIGNAQQVELVAQRNGEVWPQEELEALLEGCRA